jgi:hypothetical protein
LPRSSLHRWEVPLGSMQASLFWNLSAVASKDLDQTPTFRHFGNNSFAEQVCAVLVQRHCETQEIQVEIDIFDTYFQRVSTRKDCQSIFSTPDVVTWQSAGTHKSSCLGVKNIHLEQLIIFENQCDSFLLFFFVILSCFQTESDLCLNFSLQRSKILSHLWLSCQNWPLLLYLAFFLLTCFLFIATRAGFGCFDLFEVHGCVI